MLFSIKCEAAGKKKKKRSQISFQALMNYFSLHCSRISPLLHFLNHWNCSYCLLKVKTFNAMLRYLKKLVK